MRRSWSALWRESRLSVVFRIGDHDGHSPVRARFPLRELGARPAAIFNQCLFNVPVVATPVLPVPPTHVAPVRDPDDDQANNGAWQQHDGRCEGGHLLGAVRRVLDPLRVEGYAPGIGLSASFPPEARFALANLILRVGQESAALATVEAVVRLGARPEMRGHLWTQDQDFRFAINSFTVGVGNFARVQPVVHRTCFTKHHEAILHVELVHFQTGHAVKSRVDVTSVLVPRDFTHRWPAFDATGQQFHGAAVVDHPPRHDHPHSAPAHVAGARAQSFPYRLFVTSSLRRHRRFQRSEVSIVGRRRRNHDDVFLIDFQSVEAGTETRLVHRHRHFVFDLQTSTVLRPRVLDGKPVQWRKAAVNCCVLGRGSSAGP